MVPSLSSTLLLLTSALFVYASVLPIDRRGSLGAFQIHSPEAFQNPTPNEVTENYVTIEKSSVPSKSSAAYLRALDCDPGQNDSPTAITPVFLARYDTEYIVDITVGKQTVKVILDTGSSDTWLIKKGFQCVSASHQPTTEDTCHFGSVYNGNFAQGPIPDVYFAITYGDREFLTGNFGYEDVTFAGITVTQQEVSSAVLVLY
jgi:hypothetical protein